MKLLLAVALLSAFSVLSVSAGNLVCYFASWTIYRPDNGKFQASDVDPNLCTHILYAFVGLNYEGTVQVLDDWELNGLQEVIHLMSLKDQNPSLKVMVSMGGWNEGSEKYSHVAGDPGLRSVMVQSVVSFVNQYGFDGFDLDWEYPNQRGGVEADVQNYVALITELKSALSAEGKILSAAVAGAGKSIDLSYDIPAVSAQLDMINIMAYDFHGAFEPFVGHYAPLGVSHLDTTDDEKALNIEAGVQHWLDGGADPSKMNLGVGTYGRGFILADAANTELYAPTYGGCDAGPYTREAGILGYNEICEFHSDWERFWDDEQRVPHKISGTTWVGYDDTESLQLKVQFAQSKGLGGMMVWALDTDDFRGLCGPRYPLINTIKTSLRNN